MKLNKMNDSQKYATIAGVFGMVLHNSRGFTETTAEHIKNYIDGKNIKLDGLEKHWVNVIECQFNSIDWLQTNDNLKVYINTLSKLLTNFDYSNVKGSDLHGLILEILENQDANDDKLIEIIKDFQLDLLDLEIQEQAQDCYYSNRYLINLNNQAIKAAREADKMKKLYKVVVNGVEVVTLEHGFEFNQGELLWQAMSEQARELGINDILEEGPRLVDWGYLDDSNICSLLVDALNLEYIKDFYAVELGTSRIIRAEDSYKWEK